MEIVQGQYEKSRRLEVLSPEDKKRREELDRSQELVVNGEKHSEERRGFLGYVVAALGAVFAGVVAYPVVRYIIPPEKKVVEETSAVVAKESDIPVGTAKNVKFNNKPVFLLNQGGGTIVALSAVCTHAGCNVQWKADEKIIYCACHGGKYNTEGAVIGGPPPRPLDALKAKVQDGNITISKA